jgi:hypothetical protein
MGGKEDRNSLFLYLIEDIKKFISGKRIKTACRFIKDKDPCLVGQSYKQVELYNNY